MSTPALVPSPDTAVCADRYCPLVGRPQPVAAFRACALAKSGRVSVCRRCEARKRDRARARGRDRGRDLTAGVVSERRDRRRELVDAGHDYAAAEARLDASDRRDEALAAALRALGEIRSGRYDGRSDKEPYFGGPRAYRAHAREALEAAAALVPELVEPRPRATAPAHEPATEAQIV